MYTKEKPVGKYLNDLLNDSNLKVVEFSLDDNGNLYELKLKLSHRKKSHFFLKGIKKTYVRFIFHYNKGENKFFFKVFVPDESNEIESFFYEMWDVGEERFFSFLDSFPEEKENIKKIAYELPSIFLTFYPNLRLKYIISQNTVYAKTIEELFGKHPIFI